ncbi:MAG: M20/M25/M40 family metallo-hydrolase [Bacteroidetes bacterium]|nr:M20/M25/M40 family metallo-hydrolase [Bacteroidota bacterium]
MRKLQNLNPQSVWKHFEDICFIPHPSKHEKVVCEHIIQFAEKHNLLYKQDEVGNIVITKPATTGMEQCEPIILQAHVDMVPQKNADTEHDFLRDAIQPRIVGNFVKATNTTLGADNGIGVAVILAILESTTIAHGCIEAFFTVDEETGMTGALNTAPDFLTGRFMINTDSEDENEITLGCAGGLNANFEFSYTTVQLKDGFDSAQPPTDRSLSGAETTFLPCTTIPADFVAYKIQISKLSGGHSGFEIYENRAHANVLIADIALKAVQKFDARISHIGGGSMRNAIPREAELCVAIPAMYALKFESFISEMAVILKNIYTETDPNFSLHCEKTELPQTTIEPTRMLQILQLLNQLPQGVVSVEQETAAMVRTSSNLSIIAIKNATIEIQCLLRSSNNDEKQALAQCMQALVELYGGIAKFDTNYPAWQPVWNSQLLEITKQALQTVYNATPKLSVVHAGLECGILGEKFPAMEFVSIGPNINNPHSPDEEVEIASVERFFYAVCEILRNVPEK